METLWWQDTVGGLSLADSSVKAVWRREESDLHCEKNTIKNERNTRENCTKCDNMDSMYHYKIINYKNEKRVK